MYETVYYEKTFLKQVVARVDFVAPLLELEKSLPAKLGKAFSDRFPIMEPTETIAQDLQITGDEVKAKQEHSHPIEKAAITQNRNVFKIELERSMKRVGKKVVGMEL